MNRLKHLPLVEVTNDLIGMKYTLLPEVFGYNKNGNNSLDVDKAVLHFDIHLGLEGICEKSDLLVSVNDYELCKVFNHGLLIYTYDKVNNIWECTSPERVKKSSKEYGYIINVIQKPIGDENEQ